MHETVVILQAVQDIVRDAANLIEAVRRRGATVSHKGDEGPVTEADRAADGLLRARLLALDDVGWLSEETIDSAQRLSRRRLWIVDPLDGTKEFVEGLPQYAVAVALVEDGIPVVAVVHNPATGEVFSAVRGAGAWYNGTAIRVAEGKHLLASRTEVKRGEFDVFRDWDLQAIGSIEYKLGLVAAGRGAATLSRGPKWEWDVCAGALIVAEAGGVVTDVFGGPLRFNQPFPKVKGVLAGAPAAYHRALETVHREGPSDRMEKME